MKNKKQIIRIFFAIIFFIVPMIASANGKWSALENKNTLKLQGACDGLQVKVELYSKNVQGDPIYTSNAVCKNGSFSFDDDLTRWNIENDNYSIVINGDKNDTKQISVKKDLPVVASISSSNIQVQSEIKKDEAPDASKTDEKKSDTPEVKFLGAFVTLQQTTLDMRTWLKVSNYPSFAKASINLALDGVDLAVGKLSSLVMVLQDLSMDSTAKETKAPIVDASSVKDIVQASPTIAPAMDLNVNGISNDKK